MQLNLARAATDTAHQTWPDDESFDDFPRRLEHCLAQARPVTATGWSAMN
ncbi:hypothetical protein [Streptomyces sp900116325]